MDVKVPYATAGADEEVARQHYVRLPTPPQSLLARATEEAREEVKDGGGAQTTLPASGGLHLFLPDEITLHVFGFLDARSLCLASQTCLRWYTVAHDCNGLGPALIHRKQLQAVNHQVALCRAQQQGGGGGAKAVTPPVAGSPVTPPRVDAKGQPMSLELLEAYVTAKQSELRSNVLDARPELAHLLSILTGQLNETLAALREIAEVKKTMNENFDIFELTLRRYHFQFVEMFPLATDTKKKREPISLIIEDPTARALWDQHVGKAVYLCDFEEFFQNVVLKAYGSTDHLEEMRYCMAYFLNFPRDNTVTVYKWHILTRLFGPWDSFFDNIKLYVMGQGFLGLINRIRAEELLRAAPDQLLIRFSRTIPWALSLTEPMREQKAFSYRTKGSSSSTNEAIGKFLTELRKSNPGLRLMPFKLNGKAVYEKGTVSGYCDEANTYISRS
ncbi:Fbox domain containing protein [Acanthamoeba castellanii str. Neff]|uniref:Fbox domain containing protein n=1 Tax=Acanthamoeba castellanii (strain ATCC 30010 / Neff) TaxID=1257118 RepID=L8H2D7_ACACF|nr:Fbox domain containing protein [Acanthamoeba castellanii str. Neff]ELR18541.1 Fbox domain containing protein [Acanthamoeba castellanii str. Neff]